MEVREDAPAIIEPHATPQRRTKQKFTQEEDDKLRALVNQYGTKQWDRISDQIIGRSPRQCRDRWKNYLSPNVVSSPWNVNEDRLLLALFQRVGPHWAKIVKYFPGRTDVNIKNRWNKLQRKSQKLAPNTKIMQKIPPGPDDQMLLAAMQAHQSNQPYPSDLPPQTYPQTDTQQSYPSSEPHIAAPPMQILDTSSLNQQMNDGSNYQDQSQIHPQQ